MCYGESSGGLGLVGGWPERPDDGEVVWQQREVRSDEGFWVREKGKGLGLKGEESGEGAREEPEEGTGSLAGRSQRLVLGGVSLAA